MSYIPVDKSFFVDETANLAQKLLGCCLVHISPDGRTVGKIVETEAYLGAEDPAAHSFGGLTHRTRAMFGPPGHAYIYFSYGMHYCLNVTANNEGIGEGVLLRALEPVEGLELMQLRRGGVTGVTMTNGPGKLVQAMGVTLELYGHDLSLPPMYISRAESRSFEVAVGPRVGISKAMDLPLRFWVAGNQFVSKQRFKG